MGGRPIGILTPYGFLHAHVPGFSGLRVPARASFYVGLAGAALAAIGVETLLRGSRARWSTTSIRLAAGAIALLDVAPHALPYKRPFDYDRLRVAMSSTVHSQSSSGADLVFPVSVSAAYSAPAASAPVFRPLVNGQSGYLPPANGRTFETLGKRPFGSDQANLLRELKVTRLFLDREQVGDEEERGILTALSGSGGHPRSAGTWARHHVVLLSWAP